MTEKPHEDAGGEREMPMRYEYQAGWEKGYEAGYAQGWREGINSSRES